VSSTFAISATCSASSRSESLWRPKRAEGDPEGSYTFERGVTKTTGENGWADDINCS
jgi:hypothetical protein